MAIWETVSVGELLTQQKRQIVIDPDANYSLVTISNKREVKLREIKSGATINAQKGYIAEKGDFIYSRLSVHTGAFGIVPDTLDGALITNEMPCFKIETTKVLPEILIKMVGMPEFLWQLKQLTKGMGRVRIKENMMLSLSMRLPDITKQEQILSHIQRFEAQETELKQELTYQHTLLKKLRQQILQEAIEGKLTADWRAQNPDVEPASELLKRIVAEKAQLVKDKKIKGQKPLPPITDEEKPFELPQGWEWCRLGEALDYLTDYHANGAYEKLKKNVQLLDKPNFAIMLRTTNFHEKSRHKYKYITETAYNFLSKSKVYAEDVIMNKIADPGAVFFVDDRKQPMSLAMNLFLLRFNKKNICNKYAYFYLKSSYEYVVSFASGTATPTITKDAVNKLRFPLPPISEQQAIVTKVEKLLALCDQLESQIIQNQTHAEQLMQAVLIEAFNQNAVVETTSPKPEVAHA